MSIESVAARAGVSRNAVYRSWNSKADLVFDVVFPVIVEFHFPNTGLWPWICVRCCCCSPGTSGGPVAKAAGGGLIADGQGDENLLGRVRDPLEPISGTAFQELFERAVQRGELAADAQPDAALHLLIGAALYRVLGVDGALEPLTAFLEKLISARPVPTAGG